MSGRFRPTPFRIAFGNTPEIVQNEEEVEVVVREESQPQQLPPPTIRRIQIQEEQEETRTAMQFERVVVQENPCNLCQCYTCSYRRHQREMKLNLIIVILVIMLLILVFRGGSK